MPTSTPIYFDPTLASTTIQSLASLVDFASSTIRSLDTLIVYNSWIFTVLLVIVTLLLLDFARRVLQLGKK